jgi:WD40 repeat protein
MKVITQLIDYFLQNGILSSHDEEYLREKGYIKKFDEAYDYDDEECKQEVIHEDLHSDEFDKEFEIAKAKKKSKNRGGGKAGKKQMKADEICKNLIDLLADKLDWLQEYKTEACSDDALKIIIYLNNLSKDSLSEESNKVFEIPKSVLSGFLFVIFEADFYAVVKNRSGIAVSTYKKAISGLEYQELEKYKWILRWKEVNLVHHLVQLKRKVLAILSDNLEKSYFGMIKKLKTGDGNCAILSVLVFLYIYWRYKYVDSSNPELLFTSIPVGTIKDIRISNNGKYIAFSSRTGYVKVLKVDDKQEILHIEESKNNVSSCFSFFNNEDKIVIASENATKLQIFDLTCLKQEFDYYYSIPILAVSLSPDDKHLLVKTALELIVLDIDTKRENFVQENQGLFSSVHFIDDNKIIMPVFDLEFNITSISCFDYLTNKFFGNFNLPYSKIINKFLSPFCILTPNRKLIAYIEQGYEKEKQKSLCRLFEVKHGYIKLKIEFDVDSKYIYSAAFSKYEDYLILGCSGYIQCLNLVDNSILQIELDNKNWASSICCISSTGEIFLDSDDKIFRIDLESFSLKLKDLESMVKINKKILNLSQLLEQFPKKMHPLAFYNSWLLFKQYYSIGFGEYLDIINKNLTD